MSRPAARTSSLGTLAASIGLRGVIMIGGFASQLLLARMLQLAEYGIFMFALAWTRTATITTTLGIERVITRDIAVERSGNDWGAVQATLRWATRVVLVSSLAVCALAFGIMQTAFADRNWMPTLLLALPLIPILGLLRTKQAGLQGLGRPLASQLPEAVALPAGFIVMLGGYYLATGGMSVRRAMLLNVVAALATLLVTARLTAASVATPAEPPARAPARSHWSRTLLAMFFVTAGTSLIAQLPAILLGVLSARAAAVALFAIARTLAETGFIPLLALTPVYAPRIAVAWSAGAREEVRHIMTRWSRQSALIYLPIFVVMMAFPTQVLGVFNPRFAEAAPLLRIMCVGHMVSLAMGANAVLLVTTHHETILAKTTVGLTLVGVTVAYVLIVRFGALGAALANCAMMVLTAVTLFLVAYRWTGVGGAALLSLVKDRTGPKPHS